MTARSFLFVNVVLSVTWVAVALFVGSEYRRRSADATTAPQTP